MHRAELTSDSFYFLLSTLDFLLSTFYFPSMPKHLVISTSGNPDSNSRRMARIAFAHMQKQKVDCDWIDINDMDLPLCDADKCYGMPGSKRLSAAIEGAAGILIAAPVYNYDVAAATKNMI